MKVLSTTQTHELLQRLPKIELSYETIPHKKVSFSYNACIAIPVGRKCYAWFSFDGEDDVCYIMDINRDKRISKIYISDIVIGEKEKKLCLGTIFYGSIIPNSPNKLRSADQSFSESIFIIEDILLYQGMQMKHLYFGERLGFLERIFVKQGGCMQSFRLSMMWPNSKKEHFIPEYFVPKNIDEGSGYSIHHIQYRCLNDTLPFLNVFQPQRFKIKDTAIVSKPLNYMSNDLKNGGNGSDNTNTKTNIFSDIGTIVSPLEYRKPQYKLKTIFQACADINFDIYHLFAFGKNSVPVYYNISCIPNYKTSVFMNSIFRNIKENANLDAIEESDDEEDFENIAEDKYVDLTKTVLIECAFNIRFKKWVPLRVVDPILEKGAKVVHIGQLVSNY